VDAPDCTVHFLDVGAEEYGDAILCQFGNTTVLIDGAHPGDADPRADHPSIPEQLASILVGQHAPFHVNLLIVSHAHLDHIGCLPVLVERDLLRADWALIVDPKFGWGRAANEPPPPPSDDPRGQVAAALREEPLSADLDSADVAQFVSDAAHLEPNYNAMIETLLQRGTHIVRHGRDAAEDLVSHFQNVGLRIIGPGQDALIVLSDMLARANRDVLKRLTDALRADATIDAPTLYQRMIISATDAQDAGRLGNLVNLQSIVTSFEFGGRKFLFSGDMQFATPQTAETHVVAGLRAMRQAIAAAAPYTLVKIGHHGSDNAFSEAVLNELGTTRLFGICAGTRSTRHPNPAVLRLLDARRASLTWARTDRNGLSSFAFRGATPRIRVAQGTTNDARPNTVDDVPEPSPGEPPAVEPAPIEVSPHVSVAPGAVVEVHTTVPHVRTRVTVTIDVAPGESGEAADEPGTVRPRAVAPLTASDRPRLGGGRPLPRLLFATSSAALASNIRSDTTNGVLDAIRAEGRPLIDAAPAEVASRVQRQLQQDRTIVGVVLLGGHDVVPLQRIDCLPRRLRSNLASNDDPDNFIVWSDDVYGDREGDRVPDVPASRIPDGKSAELVLGALQAGTPRHVGPAGVRNVARPFADAVFATLRGPRPMLVSAPSAFDMRPPLTLEGDRVYLMLHGDYVDSSRFWGEQTVNNAEAINVANLPAHCEGVVFTGCCWGALTVGTPASRVAIGRPFGAKTPEDSLALSFLLRGATAFVGCTGAHYSPTVPPYQYFGGPLHSAFWRHIGAGSAPARALFEAKVDYIQGMPHGQQGTMAEAIEFKILRQYTCLGLGW
jgi:beta-lactamase superfamily II metal-dependent hydrolase